MLFTSVWLASHCCHPAPSVGFMSAGIQRYCALIPPTVLERLPQQKLTNRSIKRGPPPRVFSEQLLTRSKMVVICSSVGRARCQDSVCFPGSPIHMSLWMKVAKWHTMINEYIWIGIWHMVYLVCSYSLDLFVPVYWVICA